MMRNARAARIDRALGISAVVAIALAVASLSWSAVSRRLARTPVYSVGDRFEKLPGIDVAKSPATLVISVSRRCRFCNDSMAFYKTLTTGSRKTRVVVVGHETVAELREYLEEHGVQPDDVVSIAGLTVKLVRTPTLLLVGQDSIVRSAWEGKLQSAVEAQVVKVLTSVR